MPLKTQACPALAAAGLGLVAWAGSASGQAAGQWRGPEQMYAMTCHFCHDTGVGPVLKGSQVDPALTRQTVRQGHAAMPAFKPSDFSDADLAQLAEWLNRTPAEGTAP